MDKKELMIKKPSAMIQTNAKGLTLIQRKTINSLIHIAQSYGDQRTYKYSLKKLKKMCGITTVGNDDLKEQLRSLTDIKIEYNYLEKDQEYWEINVLLAGAIIEPNSGEVEFSFSPFLQRRILNPSMYAPLDVIMISNLKSTYTLILYEFLKDYLNSPQVPFIGIQKFKKIMGIEANKYKLFKNFRIRVLDKAVNEINTKTDIFCEYELIKESGNKYSHIKFKVEKNENFKIPKQIKTHQKNLNLFPKTTQFPKEVLKAIPEKYKIPSIYNLISSYLNDLDFLISNIEYTNKNCKENYLAYLKLALEKDYAKAEREIKVKKQDIIQEKNNHIQEKQNKEKLLKQKAWEYFDSLPETKQFELKVEAIEKMSVALKMFKTSERKNDVINAQIEKDLIVRMKQRKIG